MAYDFQASGDTITLGNTVLPPALSAYTFCAWVRPDTADNSARQMISLNDAGGSNRDMWLEFNTSGTNVVAFGYADTGGGFPQATWTSGFSAATWYFIAGVYNGTTQRIFSGTDATHKATNTPSNPPQTDAADGFIGNRSGGGKPFNGFMAEVAFYNRAVTGAELASMGAGFSPLFFTNGLIEYWPLIRSTNNLKSGRNGTASGAVATNHPRIIYPAGYKIAPFSAVAAATLRRYSLTTLGVG